MAHLSDMPEKQRNMIVNQDLPEYDDTPCVDGPALNERKMAIITAVTIRFLRPASENTASFQTIPT